MLKPMLKLVRKEEQEEDRGVIPPVLHARPNRLAQAPAFLSALEFLFSKRDERQSAPREHKLPKLKIFIVL